eukprot:TRINITY_DN51726_c0_g1_i1.p1 TRINITY_DN51726_c0_g1~~TRINITY_DN51726_c0_g1_i1.p1  ORF type:complete len:315 (+),score=65.64 TRINITY_DN51726_c0_g1_i1:94-1038(+)
MALEKSRAELKLNLLASTATGGITMSMTNWMDCLRIRWQLRGADKAVARTGGMTSYLAGLVRQEGLWGGLWKHGLATNCIACCGSMGTRIGLYPFIRDAMGAKDAETASGFRMFAAGLVSGMCGYLPWTPVFAVKTQLHSEAGVRDASGVLLTGSAKGRKRTFENGLQGLYVTAKGQGLRGLYKGAATFTARGSVLSGSQLACYDSMKTWLRGHGVEDGPRLHFVASLVASIGVTCAVMPLDSIFTSYQASRVLHPDSPHPNVFYTARHLYGVHGVAMFYRGWFAMFFRMFPTSIATFYIYEQVRSRLGLAYLD